MADDCDAAIMLARDEYWRLQRLKPDHELLRYLSKVEQNALTHASDDATRADFVKRFAPKGGNTPAAVYLGHYFLAMRDAADALEGKPARSSPSPTIERVVHEPTDDEEIPF